MAHIVSPALFGLVIAARRGLHGRPMDRMMNDRGPQKHRFVYGADLTRDGASTPAHRHLHRSSHAEPWSRGLLLA